MNRKTKIKKGDTVIVIAGRERGKVGKVLAVRPVEQKITVEKLNII
ncbi:MAG: KOW motif-containing protein, partial [Nitrospirales bacterium]